MVQQAQAPAVALVEEGHHREALALRHDDGGDHESRRSARRQIAGREAHVITEDTLETGVSQARLRGDGGRRAAQGVAQRSGHLGLDHDGSAEEAIALAQDQEVGAFGQVGEGHGRRAPDFAVDPDLDPLLQGGRRQGTSAALGLSSLGRGKIVSEGRRQILFGVERIVGVEGQEAP